MSTVETTKELFRVAIKSFTVGNDQDRTFEGIATAQIVDKQAELAIVDSFLHSMPTYMKSGGFVIDWHSNRVVGQMLSYEPVSLMEESSKEVVPAVKVKGKIFNRGYQLDDDVWQKIKSKEYRGLSFGGGVKNGGRKAVEIEGRMAYALKDIEIYEISVCPSPVNPVAVVTGFNELAKGEPNMNGYHTKICTAIGCFIELPKKADDDAISKWISELSHAHPDWKHDQVVAVAHEKVRRGETDKADTATVSANAATMSLTEASITSGTDTSAMFISNTETLKYKSDMTEENKVTEAAKAAPVEEVKKAEKAEEKTSTDNALLTKALTDLVTKLDSIEQKLTKALDKPTDLPAGNGAEVKMPSDPYNGKSEQGGARGATATSKPAESDKVVLEQKAEEKKPAETKEVIKADTPRPTGVANPNAGAKTGISKPVLDMLRKSDNPNRFGVLSNKILYDANFVSSILKGE